MTNAGFWNLRRGVSCALLAVVAAPPFAQAQTLWLEPQGGAAGMLGGGLGRAAGAVVFADMDADGEEEVVAIERVIGENLGGFKATISRWSRGGRRAEWNEFLLSGSPNPRHRVLVGNLVGSATPELVLFATAAHAGERKPPTRVFRWTGGGYAVSRSPAIGRLGALADFNGDGTAELVLARPTQPGTAPGGPSELHTYAFAGDTLERTRRLGLQVEPSVVAAADMDGDGREELLTVSRREGRLRVYRASATELLPRFASERGWLLKVEFFTVFESEGTPYIYAERGALRWRTVLRLTPSADGSFTLSAVRDFEARPRLLEDALKSTAAYSAERQTHFRLVGGDRLEAW